MNCLLREYVRACILLEGRKENVRKKYLDIPEDDWNELVTSQPEGSSNKYLEWSAKMVSQGVSVDEIINSVNLFDLNKQNLRSKDINAFKTFDELESQLNDLEGSKKGLNSGVNDRRAKMIDVPGIDGKMLYRIDTHKQSTKYGAGTKWCIAAKSPTHFRSYALQNKIKYFQIDKNRSETDPLYKVAVIIQPKEDGEIKIEFWDSTDTRHEGKEDVDVSDAVMDAIMNDVDQVTSSFMINVGPDVFKEAIGTIRLIASGNVSQRNRKLSKLEGFTCYVSKKYDIESVLDQNVIIEALDVASKSGDVELFTMILHVIRYGKRPKYIESVVKRDGGLQIVMSAFNKKLDDLLTEMIDQTPQDILRDHPNVINIIKKTIIPYKELVNQLVSYSQNEIEIDREFVQRLQTEYEELGDMLGYNNMDVYEKVGMIDESFGSSIVDDILKVCTPRAAKLITRPFESGSGVRMRLISRNYVKNYQ